MPSIRLKCQREADGVPGCYNAAIHRRNCMWCRLSVASCQLVLVAAASAVEIASPLSPDEAVKHFQLADASLKIELAAAEPEVVDPVAIRFDEDGRMWVVEMRDYPLGNPSN